MEKKIGEHTFKAVAMGKKALEMKSTPTTILNDNDRPGAPSTNLSQKEIYIFNRTKLFIRRK